MRTGIIASSILVATLGQCFAQSSGNELRETCQFLVKRSAAQTPVDVAKSGLCLGYVNAFLSLGPHLKPDMAFCIPKGVTPAQTTLVLLQYLDADPSETHQPAVALAIVAFRSAWPCK
jgi:hypothetical protein